MENFDPLRTHTGDSIVVAPSQTLPDDANDGPLVWIDCEMTGLDPSKDKIIEIAVRRLVNE
jgi:DNA polymerase III epsilon subunit-like protein